MKTRVEHIFGEIRGSILDIGCTGGLQSSIPPTESTNWVHGQLARRFGDVWGLDISKEKIHYLHEHGYAKTIVADAQDFDLDRQFDSIVAGEVIEHLENPAGFLRSAARHLSPGGRIIVTTPYAQGLINIVYAWVKFPRTCSNPEHTMWYCPSTLSVLAERCGLKVERWELVTDIIPAGKGGGRLFRLLSPLFLKLQPLLPARVRANCMIAVLVPS